MHVSGENLMTLGELVHSIGEDMIVGVADVVLISPSR
jgi:hypothetical protein